VVENITHPNEVTVGEKAYITVTVTNVGDEAGVYHDIAMVNTAYGWVSFAEPGEAVQPGETWTWHLWYKVEEPGTHTFRIFNAQEQVTVEWVEN